MPEAVVPCAPELVPGIMGPSGANVRYFMTAVGHRCKIVWIGEKEHFKVTAANQAAVNRGVALLDRSKTYHAGLMNAALLQPAPATAAPLSVGVVMGRGIPSPGLQETFSADSAGSVESDTGSVTAILAEVPEEEEDEEQVPEERDALKDLRDVLFTFSAKHESHVITTAMLNHIMVNAKPEWKDKQRRQDAIGSAVEQLYLVATPAIQHPGSSHPAFKIAIASSRHWGVSPPESPPVAGGGGFPAATVPETVPEEVVPKQGPKESPHPPLPPGVSPESPPVAGGGGFPAETVPAETVPETVPEEAVPKQGPKDTTGTTTDTTTDKQGPKVAGGGGFPAETVPEEVVPKQGPKESPHPPLPPYRHHTPSGTVKVDGKMYPIDTLVVNTQVRILRQNPRFEGKWCQHPHPAHDPMKCNFVHKAKAPPPATIPGGRTTPPPPATPAVTPGPVVPAGGDSSPTVAKFPDGLIIVMDTSTLHKMELKKLKDLVKTNRIIIPAAVVNEIDGQKKGGKAEGEVQESAKELNKWFAENTPPPGSSNPGNVRFQSRLGGDTLELAEDKTSDDKIVGCALFFRRSAVAAGQDCVLGTDDHNMGVKAKGGEAMAVFNHHQLCHWSPKWQQQVVNARDEHTKLEHERYLTEEKLAVQEEQRKIRMQQVAKARAMIAEGQAQLNALLPQWGCGECHAMNDPSSTRCEKCNFDNGPM